MYLNWLSWFDILILEGGLLVILIVLMIFLSPFVVVTRMSMSTISFFAQLDGGILVPIECLSLIHDQNGFNSGIKRHLLTVCSF